MVYHMKKDGARDGTGSSASIRPGSILREISGEMLHGLSLGLHLSYQYRGGLIIKAGAAWYTRSLTLPSTGHMRRELAGQAQIFIFFAI